jgi:hypothetical protein
MYSKKCQEHSKKLGDRGVAPIDIKVLAFEHELVRHPDRFEVERLLQGLEHGFHTGIAYLPSVSFECKNLLSASKYAEDTSRLIEQEVGKGFLSGPFTYPPFDTVRINPIGVVESKYSGKKRLIVDMSAPHNLSNVHSINDLIDKQDFSLTYVRLDDAIKLIKLMKQDTPLLLCKTDIADAFKQIPLLSELWPYHGIAWQGGYYFFTRLVFGCRSSPKIFDTVATAICWILEHNYGVSPLLHLLDDFLAICPPDKNPHEFMNTMLTVFKILGIPLSAAKTVGPVTNLEYLGIELCTEQMKAKLPQNKLQRIRGMVASFLTRKKCRKRQLLSLLGHLQFACRVVTAGRAFTARLLQAASSVRELCHFVTLTQEARRDLHMWHILLSNWNGVSLFLDIHTTDSYDMELWTDASGVGFGGYFKGHWFYGEWSPNLPELLDSQDSIAFRELYPIIVAALLFGTSWGQKRIMFRCDNMATVFAINKARSRSPAMMQLLRRLVLIATQCNFAFSSEHVPGCRNDIADSLSRLQLDRFRRLAPHADPWPTPLPTAVMFA